MRGCAAPAGPLNKRSDELRRPCRVVLLVCGTADWNREPAAGCHPRRSGRRGPEQEKSLRPEAAFWSGPGLRRSPAALERRVRRSNWARSPPIIAAAPNVSAATARFLRPERRLGADPASCGRLKIRMVSTSVPAGPSVALPDGGHKIELPIRRFGRALFAPWSRPAGPRGSGGRCDSPSKFRDQVVIRVAPAAPVQRSTAADIHQDRFRRSKGPWRNSWRPRQSMRWIDASDAASRAAIHESLRFVRSPRRPCRQARTSICRRAFL